MNRLKFYFIILTTILLNSTVLRAQNDRNITAVCDAEFTTIISGLFVDFFHSHPENGINYSWDFGDGNTSNVKDPSHVYTAPNTYTVSLSINRQPGCFDVYTKKIIVQEKIQQDKISIKGIVKRANGAPVENGRIIAYKYISGPNPTFQAIDTTQIEAEGYKFLNLPTGRYIIKSMLHPLEPDFFNYAPTYYVESYTSDERLFWHNGELITVSSPQMVKNHNISLYPVKQIHGLKSISGKIVRTVNGNTTSLEGKTILLFDKDDEIVSYTYSDNNGYFSFKDLPEGKYKVFPEVPGIKTYPLSVFLNNSKNHAYVLMTSNDIEINGKQSTTGIENRDRLAELKLFPNPAQYAITITHPQMNEFQIENIQVIDITGKKHSTPYTRRDNKIELDISQLPNGVFHVFIEDFNLPMRFVKFN